MATTMAVAALVIFGSIALLLPGDLGAGSWRAPDRVLVFAVGAAIASVCWRYATIRAVPTREGLLVRNLFLTRTLTWPEVIGVEFGGGAPWVTLELNDTDTVAVMAIQRADGPTAMAEARRLAGLVRDLGEVH